MHCVMQQVLSCDEASGTLRSAYEVYLSDIEEGLALVLSRVSQLSLLQV